MDIITYLMQPASLQTAFWGANYPYEFTHKKKTIIWIGSVLALISIGIGIAALRGEIPLQRRISMHLCINIPILSALVVLLLTHSSKLYNSSKYGITSVSEHNTVVLRLLAEFRSNVMTFRESGKCDAGAGEEIRFSPIHNITASSIHEGYIQSFVVSDHVLTINQEEIDQFSDLVAEFIKGCTRREKPLWVSYTLTVALQQGGVQSTLSADFFREV